MTVKEFIEELKQFDPDQQIVTMDTEGDYKYATAYEETFQTGGNADEPFYWFPDWRREAINTVKVIYVC